MYDDRSHIPESSGRTLIVFNEYVFVMDFMCGDARVMRHHPRRSPSIRICGIGPSYKQDKVGNIQVEVTVLDLLGSGHSKSVCDVEFLGSVTFDDCEKSHRLHMFSRQAYTSDVVEKCWVSETQCFYKDVKESGIQCSFDDDDEEFPLYILSVRFLLSSS